MCGERRELKTDKITSTTVRKYRDVNNKIRKGIKMFEEKWLEEKCVEIENNINRNNTKMVCQILKEMTREKKSWINIIQDKPGRCLTLEKELMGRWTDYCSELYAMMPKDCMDHVVLNCPLIFKDSCFPILHDELAPAVKSLTWNIT